MRLLILSKEVTSHAYLIKTCDNMHNLDETDQQLIASYFEGNAVAFSELLKRHLDAVYNFSYRLSGDALLAEDIAQETFVKAWKNLKAYDRDRNFKTWLFAIARNTTIDHLRKRKNIPFSVFENNEGENFFVENIQDTAPTALELFALAERKEVVESALLQISPKYKEVLLLHEGEDMTFAEIGKMLDRPLDTVKSQYRRALLALKEIILVEEL